MLTTRTVYICSEIQRIKKIQRKNGFVVDFACTLDRRECIDIGTFASGAGGGLITTWGNLGTFKSFLEQDISHPSCCEMSFLLVNPLEVLVLLYEVLYYLYCSTFNLVTI